MKKTILIFLFVAQFTLPSLINSQINQDWKWSNQFPQGNALMWVKMWDANNWYAVGNNGTFMKTTNSGQNWYINHKASALYGSGEAANLYCGYFFNQNTGFVAGTNTILSYYSGGGVYKTTNGGVTFDSVPGFRYDKPISYYQMYFVNNNFGYIVGYYWEGGVNYPIICKTNNGGQTWTNIGQNITVQNVKARGVYAWDTTNVIVCANYGEVFKSTDAGQTWNYTITGNSADLTKVKFVDANTGFTCGGNSTFRYTTNGGVSWTVPTGVPSGTFYDINYCNNSNGLNVFLSGNNYYIYRTTNLGVSWDTIKMYQTNLPSANEIYSSDISSNGDTILSVGYFGNINRTVGLSNRTNISKNIKGGIIYDVWAQGSGSGNVITVGTYTSSSIFARDQITRSTDGGLSWSVSTYSGVSRPTFNCIQMINDNTGWVVGTYSSVYKTTNGGATWDSVGVNGMSNNVVLSKVFFVNENTGWLFASSFPSTDSNTNFKTTDGGTTWTKSMIQNSKHNIMSASFVDANTGWVVDNKTGRPYKTTDGGSTWSQQSVIDNATMYTYDIQMLNANTGYFCGGVRRVYKTTNGGTLWDTCSTPNLNTNGTLYGLHFINANTGVTVGNNGITFITTNAGANWTLENTASGMLHNVYMTPNGKMFAVADMGQILKNESIITGIESNTTGIPNSYFLSQNYPNPFNPTTTIQFGLPKAGIVSLKVFDITGREIDNIINNLYVNPGTMKVTFDGSKLSSGVYFYSLYTDNKLVLTKKMLLIK